MFWPNNFSLSVGLGWEIDVCWKKTSPRRLVGQSRWILDTPVSTACNWSWISRSVCFLGVNHPYLPLWFIAIVAFFVLTTIVHCLWLIGPRAQFLSDQTSDALSHQFLSFTTTVVSVSLCHHCFHHLAFQSLISLCLQCCDMYCRFSTVNHFVQNSLYHPILSTGSTYWKFSGKCLEMIKQATFGLEIWFLFVMLGQILKAL